MTTFYTTIWNVPGYLPDACEPPPVFGDYDTARDYLADELETIASGYDENDRDGDRFESMAEQCRESTEEDRFAMDGPDGYRYSVDETESRGQWIAGETHTDDDGIPSHVVLTYTERSDGLGLTAKEAADDVSSLCGSMVEREDTMAYTIIDSDRLSEAAGELRESGFELVDSDGELIEED